MPSQDRWTKEYRQAAERCRAQFAGLFVKCTTEAPSPRLPLLSLYFLVPRPAVTSFRQAFRQLTETESARLLLSGPWPPYNFVTSGPSSWVISPRPAKGVVVMDDSVASLDNSPESQRYQQLYDMLLDAIPSSVLLIDRDLRIASANRNFLEKNRRTLPDTIGHRLDEVFPAIIIDQMDFPGRIRQVFEKNFRIKGERMTYRAPGIPLRIYYYSILPFSWQGVVELAMLLMDDVTEQVRLSEEVRRVERHLASVVESAQDIVLSTDMEGQILTWNTAAERLSGFTLHAVRGHNFFDFCAGDDQGEMERIFANLQAGKEAQMAEWDLKTRDGGRIPVSWIFSPMKDHLGQTAGMVAVGRDLTERRKFEAQLLQSQKLAALGVMAGGIAHEIRNPLAVCCSAAQFIMEERCHPGVSAGVRRKDPYRHPAGLHDHRKPAALRPSFGEARHQGNRPDHSP